MAKAEFYSTDVAPVLLYGWDGTLMVKVATDADGVIKTRSSLTTPTIYNAATAGAGWTAVATGLTGVKSWKLVEENGNDFRYAFVAAPATYINGFGWVSEASTITAIYVQRPTAADINMQLLTWE